VHGRRQRIVARYGKITYSSMVYAELVSVCEEQAGFFFGWLFITPTMGWETLYSMYLCLLLIILSWALSLFQPFNVDYPTRPGGMCIYE
jgi:ABC-type polysaccharide/polyol phosphate export permease